MKKKVTAITLGAAAFLLSASMVLAQGFGNDYGGGGTLDGTMSIVGSFGTIANMLLWIMATIALLVFFWGIVKYISAAGDADKAKEGKSIMIYGAIALFVMFSIFGIIRWLRGEFGIQHNQDIGNPEVNPVNQAF